MGAALSRRAAGAVLAGALLSTSAATQAQGTPALVKRGEYMFRAAGCATCHTGTEKNDPRLAGGRRLETPFGVFHSPNITPDPRYGIGGWRAGDLVRALRQGTGPGSVHYYPVFPYPSYAGMREEDIVAMMAYLQRVPAVPRKNRPHELPWYLRFRMVNYFWKLLFHSATPFAERADRSAQWNRGAYLVNAVGHCGECHTPRNAFGALIEDRHLAGNPDGPDGDAVPNITPHEQDGIGRWSAYEISQYLQSGLDPEGDMAGGAMVDVIDESLSHLSGADIEAIVVYLRQLPARKSPPG